MVITMVEQRRVGYHWRLRQVMAEHNLWKTTELVPLLKSRGVNLSNAQVHRLVTQPPERIPARTFAALCDIFDCTPNDLFEPMSKCAPLPPPTHPSAPRTSASSPAARSPAESASLPTSLTADGPSTKARRSIRLAGSLRALP